MARDRADAATRVSSATVAGSLYTQRLCGCLLVALGSNRRLGVCSSLDVRRGCKLKECVSFCFFETGSPGPSWPGMYHVTQTASKPQTPTPKTSAAASLVLGLEGTTASEQSVPVNTYSQNRLGKDNI